MSIAEDYAEMIDEWIKPAINSYPEKETGFDPVLGIAIYVVRRMVDKGIDVDELMEGLRRHAMKQNNHRKKRKNH